MMCIMPKGFSVRVSIFGILIYITLNFVNFGQIATAACCISAEHTDGMALGSHHPYIFSNSNGVLSLQRSPEDFRSV